MPRRSKQVMTLTLSLVLAPQLRQNTFAFFPDAV